MSATRQPKPRHRLTRNYVAERSRAYRQLWRVVDGAVFDALYSHQDYLTDKGRRSARESINKRVVGAVLGYALEAKGRSALSAAVERGGPVGNGSSRTVFESAVSKVRVLLGALTAIVWRRA